MATDQSGSTADLAVTRFAVASLGRVESLLWVLVLAALLGDLTTTYVGLERGLVETNPVARAAMAVLGYPGLAVLKTAALGVAVSCRALVPRRYGVVVPATMGSIWTAAVGSNLLLLAVVW